MLNYNLISHMQLEKAYEAYCLLILKYYPICNIQGFRHPETTTVSRTVRVINTCLCIVSKNLPDKFAVTPETTPYLTGE